MRREVVAKRVASSSESTSGELMHFDPTLHEKTRRLILSDDGLTLTNTQSGGIYAGFTCALYTQ